MHDVVKSCIQNSNLKKTKNIAPASHVTMNLLNKIYLRVAMFSVSVCLYCPYEVSNCRNEKCEFKESYIMAFNKCTVL